MHAKLLSVRHTLRESASLPAHGKGFAACYALTVYKRRKKNPLPCVISRAHSKKKSALDSHLTGHCSFAVCQGRCTRQRGEMHTSKFESLLCDAAVTHSKKWIRGSSIDFFAVCLGHCTRQSDNILCVFLFCHVYGTPINTSGSNISQ